LKPSSSSCSISFFGDFVAGFGIDFTGFHVDDVLGQILADHVLVFDQQVFDALSVSCLAWRGVIFLPASTDNFAGGIDQVTGAFMPFHLGSGRTASSASLGLTV
jgi:hypothetical protein